MISDTETRIREIIAQAGESSLAEILELCPYRSLIGPKGDMDPGTVPMAVIAVLGFKPEDLSDNMRADIMEELLAGNLVLLISNSSILRDYARREILLAVSSPAGSA